MSASPRRRLAVAHRLEPRIRRTVPWRAGFVADATMDREFLPDTLRQPWRPPVGGLVVIRCRAG